MKMRTMVLTTVITAILVCGSAFATGQDSNFPPPPPPPPEGFGQQMHPMGPPHSGPDGIIGIIMHELDPNDAQKEKIETILDNSRDNMEAAREAVQKARQALDEAVKNDANEPAIRKAANILGNAIADEAILKAKVFKEIKSVLTTEQLKELDQIMAKIKQEGPRPRRDRGSFERQGKGELSTPPTPKKR